jgi:hypothetical protein
MADGRADITDHELLANPVESGAASALDYGERDLLHG